jgi:hypothetical protein
MGIPAPYAESCPSNCSRTPGLYFIVVGHLRRLAVSDRKGRHREGDDRPQFLKYSDLRLVNCLETTLLLSQ